MKNLVIEGTHPVSRIEVNDWLYGAGVIAYEIQPLSNGYPANSKKHGFLVTTSDSASRHVLTRLAGRKIGQSMISVRIDNSNQHRFNKTYPHYP